ncbi:MAG: glutathione S-transferase family protein [Rhodospirillales bacterium]
MADIILHHYPTSPFSEKVRIAFGLKQLAWKGVTIPVIMPKPDLMPLTGGYRKTPVMQIGADIYCDTQIILREIEHRHPSPSFYPPGGVGTADIISLWADRLLFSPSVGVVFATIGDKVPDAFKQDRAKFSGRDFNAERMKSAMPMLHDQFRAGAAFIEDALSDGRKFLQGAQAGLADLGPYHCIWFVQRNLGADWGCLKAMPRLRGWVERMAAIGHGTPSEIDAKQALAIAKAATAQTKEAADPNDPNGRKPGDKIRIAPDDTGRDPVTGTLVMSNAEEIVIRRNDPAVGEVMVHFPRAGFVVMSA